MAGCVVSGAFLCEHASVLHVCEQISTQVMIARIWHKTQTSRGDLPHRWSQGAMKRVLLDVYWRAPADWHLRLALQKKQVLGCSLRNYPQEQACQYSHQHFHGGEIDTFAVGVVELGCSSGPCKADTHGPSGNNIPSPPRSRNKCARMSLLSLCVMPAAASNSLLPLCVCVCVGWLGGWFVLSISITVILTATV